MRRRRPPLAPIRASAGLAAFLCSGASLALAQDAAPQPAPESTPAPVDAEAPDAEHDEWTEGETLTSTPAELDDMYAPHTAMLNIPAFDGLIDRFFDVTSSIDDAVGLRMGFAYTTIFQQASGGSGYRRGASGDLDIMGAWTLLGRGTPNTGELIFSFEDRHKFGPQSANDLRGVLGTLHPPTNGFNDRGFVVRDVYWIQRLFDGKLGFALGRGDTSDFFGGHRMQSLNVSFSNRSLSANTVIPSPGHGMFAGVSFRPIDQFYATIGGANAYGSTTINDMKYLEEGKFFTFGEFGYTPEIKDLGSGRYRLVLWNIDARDRRVDTPSDYGFSVIADQDIGERLLIFARYGYADDGGVTNIRWSAEGGFGIRGLLGSTDNLTGLGFAYTDPNAAGADDEKIIEAFHRFQLTRHTQFSLGIQGIFDPANSDDDALAVFTARFRIVF